MRLGAARTVIRWPLGLPMAGYSARTVGGSGVHLPLHVRALVANAKDGQQIRWPRANPPTDQQGHAASPSPTPDMAINCVWPFVPQPAGLTYTASYPSTACAPGSGPAAASSGG